MLDKLKDYFCRQTGSTTTTELNLVPNSVPNGGQNKPMEKQNNNNIPLQTNKKNDISNESRITQMDINSNLLFASDKKKQNAQFGPNGKTQATDPSCRMSTGSLKRVPIIPALPISSYSPRNDKIIRVGPNKGVLSQKGSTFMV